MPFSGSTVIFPQVSFPPHTLGAVLRVGALTIQLPLWVPSVTRTTPGTGMETLSPEEVMN